MKYQPKPLVGDKWRARDSSRHIIRIVAISGDAGRPAGIKYESDPARPADPRSAVPAEVFFSEFEHSGWRGPRRMPSMKVVARRLGMETPECVRCGRDDVVLDRAHLIDRVYHGLDNAANLAPLCGWCHKVQPIFEPGDEAAALEWFKLSPLEPAPVSSHQGHDASQPPSFTVFGVQIPEDLLRRYRPQPEDEQRSA